MFEWIGAAKWMSGWMHRQVGARLGRRMGRWVRGWMAEETNGYEIRYSCRNEVTEVNRCVYGRVDGDRGGSI